MRTPFFLLGFAILVFLAVLHHLAIIYYWYWIFPWFDLLTHFLGGLWVGLFVLWLFFLSGYTDFISYTPRRAVILSAFSTLSIGIVWEVFELVMDIVLVSKAYPMDTALDLVMDMAGSLAASALLILSVRVRLQNPPNQVRAL